jgi:hypothetical protein
MIELTERQINDGATGNRLLDLHGARRFGPGCTIAQHLLNDYSIELLLELALILQIKARVGCELSPFLGRLKLS